MNILEEHSTRESIEPTTSGETPALSREELVFQAQKELALAYGSLPEEVQRILQKNYAAQ